MKRAKRGAVKLIQIFIITLLAGIHVGCGSNTRETTGEGKVISVESMESKPVIEYVVPRLSPNVLVDRVGYPTTSVKEAAVKGRELPEEFRLVNADSGEVVYQGLIEKVIYNQEMKVYTGQIEFSQYKEPGNYYLECDKIGRSYTFPIVEKLYIKLFEEERERIYNRCRKDEAGVFEVFELLTAYEWYPNLFEDADGNEVPDVLELIAAWMQRQDVDEQETENDILRAALLAKFSYLYQKYDKPFATKCLQGASAMYEQSQKSIRKDAESFLALTELYRATGLWTYRNQIADYKSYFESNTHLEETEYLYGSMTYMVTRQKVDVGLCNTLIDKMMECGEELAGNSAETLHPVNAKNNGAEDILFRANEIVFVNYVLNSYQYNNVLEDFLHYLSGRNLESVIFEKEESDEYLLLLAQMASMPEKK